MEADDSHCSVEEEARRRIGDCAYRRDFRHVTISFDDGVLAAHGRVASFHLKQLLQTQLAGIDGVKRLDNQVDVTSY